MRMEAQRQEKKIQKAISERVRGRLWRRETRLRGERWINALFELCKRDAWVMENKLCVCVKEAENGRERRKERRTREVKKVTARDRESDSSQRRWAFTVGFM